MFSFGDTRAFVVGARQDCVVSSPCAAPGASHLCEADTVLFSGIYQKHGGQRLIPSEIEVVLLREYRVEELTEALIRCGSRALKLFRSSQCAFLASSGCSLIEARADA